MLYPIQPPQVVIVGSNQIAMSCLEGLAMSSQVVLTNLYLVSRDDPDSDRSPSLVNMSPVAWGLLDPARSARLALRSVANVVIGSVTGLDRDNRTVTVDRDRTVAYDLLVLAVDKVPPSPLPESGLAAAANYFMIECLAAGRSCLDWVGQNWDGGTEPPRQYLIVYGLSIHSLGTLSWPRSPGVINKGKV